MARKTVPRNKVKNESNAAAESVEDVSDNERKNTAEDSKPAKRGRKTAKQNNSDQTEVNDEASSSKNKVSRKKVKNELNAAAESVEDVSDNDRKNTAEDSKPAKRGRKTAKQNNSDQTEVNDEASSNTNEVPRKKVKKESNAATESVEDVSDNEKKNTSEDSKPAKRGRKTAKQNNSDQTEVNDEASSSTNEVKSKNSSLTEKEDEEKAKKVSKETDKGTKRKRGAKKVEDTAKQSKSAKKEKQSDSSKKPKNKTSSEFSTIDFTNESKSPAGNPWNLKISSWNINGLRAWLEKDGMSYLHHEKPDILCVQETKCSDSNLPEEMKNVEGYHAYWLSGDKDGYSGVGLLSKEKPKNIEYGIGVSEHDNEGRVITAEYEDFYLVGTYVPNAGRGLVRLDYRQKWDEDFRAYLKKLDSEKPVILCGDLNVAHEEIDLANPKTNKKNAGFTKEEREGFSNLLKEGFVDTFRRLYPDLTGAYTFWTYMMNARAKNVGWRLDYFVLSERLCEKLCDNVIRKDVFGSDHCPITLFLSL